MRLFCMFILLFTIVHIFAFETEDDEEKKLSLRKRLMNKILPNSFQSKNQDNQGLEENGTGPSILQKRVPIKSIAKGGVVIGAGYVLWKAGRHWDTIREKIPFVGSSKTKKPHQKLSHANDGLPPIPGKNPGPPIPIGHAYRSKNDAKTDYTIPIVLAIAIVIVGVAGGLFLFREQLGLCGEDGAGEQDQEEEEETTARTSRKRRGSKKRNKHHSSKKRRRPKA